MTAHLVKLQSAPDLVERVYGALLDAISEGSLAPGARFTREEIAAQLDVSRQPVLQALRLLKKDGLVLDAPGSGVIVAPLDAGWIAQVYEVRAALDTLAARLAAQRRAVIDARLVEQGRRAARGRHIKAMIETDMAFHNAISPHRATRSSAAARSCNGSICVVSWARCCNRPGQAKRCGTSTKPLPRRSPPAMRRAPPAASRSTPGRPAKPFLPASPIDSLLR